MIGVHEGFLTGGIAGNLKPFGRGAELLRVRVFGVVEYLVSGSFFDDSAIVHDDHTIGEMPNDGEVVGHDDEPEKALCGEGE